LNFGHRKIKMTFIADLHIHSKYSRATAKNLDLENLYRTAQIKGIAVVGTGDFTHPAWIEEIESKLEEAEPGLFSLKREIAEPIDETVPRSCRKKVRFILQTEISNIYKRGGRVRKNHNLIYFPDLSAVKKFNARLDGIGNIKSDGRPILGLDARALLEIMLETSDQGLFVPAHIWTPWFSMFGSKSGFDTIEACFGDLKDHIFAVETGLSSDPPMNWRVSDLDHVSLISNSDAHSPGYMGRNASVFNTDLDYFAMRSALETRSCKTFHGTLDMFPHQGKYHYDGHRKCNVSLNPETTEEYGGICPVCKKPLTLGVLYRVQELASRSEGYLPKNRQGYTRIIPLTDILAQIFQVGPKTQKVAGYYQNAIEALGPELPILTDHSFDKIQGAGVPLLAEAIMKMRTGDILIDPGFDGEYGKVNIFSRRERETLRGEKTFLFSQPAHRVSSGENSALPPDCKKSGFKKSGLGKPVLAKTDTPLTESDRSEREPGLLEGLNPDQKQAVESDHPAILIQAGPGTGKTRTLTAKIAFLVSEKKTDPGSILALTFTNKAARQLSQRIDAFLPKEGSRVLATTFHGFCLKFLKEYFEFDAGIMSDTLRLTLVKNGLEIAMQEDSSRDNRTWANGTRGAAARGGFSGKKGVGELDRIISLCKQQLLGPFDDLSSLAGTQDVGVLRRVYTAYQQQCREKNLVDFEELIFLWYSRLIASPGVLARVQKRFAHIFIDEYQDLNHGQYELVKLLAQKSRLVVIGDPDQSIYGFRGSDNTYFKRFSTDYPSEQIFLHRNYRSTQTILDASFQMISHSPESCGSPKIFSTLNTTQKLIIKETSSGAAEAVAVGKMIETLVGGLSFFSIDARNIDARNIDAQNMDLKNAGSGEGPLVSRKEYSFSDFAVLFRTRKQSEPFVEVFQKQGIPFQTADKKNRYTQDGIQQVLSLFRIITNRAHKTDYQIIGDHLKETGQIQVIPDPVFDQVRDTLTCLEMTIDYLNVRSKIRQTDAQAATYESLVSLARLYPVPKEFMDYLTLDQDPDHLTGSVERVSLLTLHSAKGLEYPVVFVTGCEQGWIPFARDGKTFENLEEERRLFYVGMTRAMDILCLTYAQKRRIYGTSQKRQRSFFIDDIEKRLAQYEKPVVRAMEKKKEIQLELF
jgi:ATP-dependent DNA helicase UvrD/PcrA